MDELTTAEIDSLYSRLADAMRGRTDMAKEPKGRTPFTPASPVCSQFSSFARLLRAISATVTGRSNATSRPFSSRDLAAALP